MRSKEYMVLLNNRFAVTATSFDLSTERNLKTSRELMC